jgi:hypothetical protein
LSYEEFATGVHPIGSTEPRGPLKLALLFGSSFAECETHLADGVLVGDANLDGRFNSQDLISIFQAGEYLDEISDNSTWEEGDWTCDGDFDTGDLVAAFQAGNCELPAAMAALGLSESREVGRKVSQADDTTRIIDMLEAESIARGRELVGGTVAASFRSRRPDPRLPRDLATDEAMMDLKFLE